MDRSNNRVSGAKRNAIEMGAAAIDRLVRGKYEWRDGGLQPAVGARRRFWSEYG